MLREAGDWVTIALGILAYDSIVLAADTEIGLAHYLKTQKGKISFARQSSVDEGQMAALAITGAGGTSHLEHIQHDFTQLLTVTETPRSTNEFRTFAAEYIENFYARHVLPFSGNSESPDVWTLLAYRDAKGMMLCSTEKNLLNECDTYAAVGTGALYARILLNRLFLRMWPMNTQTAILLSAYVIFHVKECVDGCGKNTDIVCLGDDNVKFIERNTIRRLEDIFESISVLEADILKSMFRDESPAYEGCSVDDRITELRNEIGQCIQL